MFPKIPNVYEKNYVIGRDFDIMKRNLDKYEHKLFNYSIDRFVPLRKELKPRFNNHNNEKEFNILLSENVNKMKKLLYQKEIRKIFSEENEQKDKVNNNSNEVFKNKRFIQFDWACKLEYTSLRDKFLPDFETLEKKSFFKIHTYLWSSKQIIAASSRKKVCLYHPINGFTRALDINDRVCITFSNCGEYLAMAYRKSNFNKHIHDLYVFHIQHEALFTDEKLETEKIRTNIENDITALCYTKNDSHLMCGTNKGEIFVIAQTSNPKKRRHYWTLINKLNSQHEYEIVKICFSATNRYMATIDARGNFKIWNGSSWTHIFTYCSKESSRVYKFFEWHPFVDNELIFARQSFPGIFLFNITQRKVIASFVNWKDDWKLTSIAFNPKTAQLAVCFYNQEEFINRVSILASMSQIISSFDFDYIEGGLKLFWNTSGNMLGAGAQSFRFAFWSFQKTCDFNLQSKEAHITENTKKPAKLLTMSDSKLNCLR